MSLSVLSCSMFISTHTEEEDVSLVEAMLAVCRGDEEKEQQQKQQELESTPAVRIVVSKGRQVQCYASPLNIQSILF